MSERRIEGSGVDPQLTEGLAAPVADALWMLARQWQVGEFRGEDAATPMVVEAVVDFYPITTVAVPGVKPMPYAPGETLIETLAEREPATSDLYIVAEAGLALLRRLRRVGTGEKTRALLRQFYPLRSEEVAEGAALGDVQLARLIAGSFNAAGLLADIDKYGGDLGKLDMVNATPAAELTAFENALAAWKNAEAELVSVADPDAAAWRDRSQDYTLAIRAETDSGPIEAKAPAYPGGRLDWYDFDLVSQPEKLTEANRKVMRTLVSPLRFAGQPAPRWWEIEEGDTYYGDLAGGPDDLARSVIASYATVAGDDWFVIPLRLPSGCFARVSGLRVNDNFLDAPASLVSTAEADAEAAARTKQERVWRWSELSPVKGAAHKVTGPPILLLMPATNTTEQGRPLERVSFRRDEMANIAWAIEKVVPGPMGQGLRNSAAWPLPAVPTEPGTWRFELGTQIPRHWYPMVPVRLTGDALAMTLRRGVLAQDPEAPPQAPPAGVLLKPGEAFYLDEATLPKGGTNVVRRWQMARSADGGTHLWLGREKRPAHGPMERTPLEFDKLSGYPIEFRRR